MMSKRILPVVMLAALMFANGLPAANPSAAPQQDPTFRLMNLERRVDQMQSRMDFIERNQQSQALAPATTNQYNNELVLELQRQQLSLAQQVIQHERRLLDMQKTIDRLAENLAEKKPKEGPPAKNEEGAKPKTTPRKP
jgi:hypothetical protein